MNFITNEFPSICVMAAIFFVLTPCRVDTTFHHPLPHSSQSVPMTQFSAETECLSSGSSLHMGGIAKIVRGNRSASAALSPLRVRFRSPSSAHRSFLSGLKVFSVSLDLMSNDDCYQSSFHRAFVEFSVCPTIRNPSLG